MRNGLFDDTENNYCIALLNRKGDFINDSVLVVGDGLLCANNAKALIQKSNKWGILNENTMSIKYLPGSEYQHSAMVDSKGNLLTHGDSSISLYNSDGDVLKNSSAQLLSKYQIADFNDSFILFHAQSSFENPYAKTDTNDVAVDSILIWNIYYEKIIDSFYLTQISRKGTNSFDCRFFNSPDSVIAVQSNNQLNSEQLSGSARYSILSRRSNRITLAHDFLTDPQTSFQVINKDYTRTKQKFFSRLFYYNGNYGVASPRIFFEGTSILNQKKIALFNAQQPVVNFTNSPYEILHWINLMPKTRNEKETVNKYLNYETNWVNRIFKNFLN